MHILIDLETLATTPGAVIIEIAAAVFDPVTGEIPAGGMFTVEVKPSYGLNALRVVDAPTVGWWAARVMEDGAVCPGDGAGAVDLETALQWVTDWMKRVGVDKETRVWSWGIDFDLTILRDAAKQCGVVLEWNPFRQRDARTLCALAGVKKAKATHVAASDVMDEVAAVAQAVAVLGIAEENL